MTHNVPQRLLAVATVLGSLSLVLTPIVASAKRQGQITAITNLKKIGLAAAAYAADYDQEIVLTQQGDAGFDRTWPVLLMPYVNDQKVFFDPARRVVTTPTVKFMGTELPWSTVTTLAINDSGYSGTWRTTTKTCAGRRILYTYGQRNLSTMVDPEKRVAFGPSAYANTDLGWYFFHSYDASWTRNGLLESLFSWNNMVWNTQGLYSNKRIPVVLADGSSSVRLSAANFKAYTERTSALAQTAYCGWMDTGGKATWGSAWSTD